MNTRPTASNGADAPPSKIMSGRPHMWRNVALDGTGFNILANTVTTRRDPVLKYAAIPVLWLWGGHGNINAGQTGAQVYTATADYADTARIVAPALIVIAVTMLPFGTFTAPEEAERTAYNSALNADASSKFDYVIDVNAGGGSVLQDTGDTTYYETDTQHLKSAGTDVIEALAAPTFDAILQ